MSLRLPHSVSLTELLARDGLQHESKVLPTEAKVYFIDQSSEAGFHTIEVTNFAHPRLLPQFRDAEEVLKRIKRLSGVTYKCYGMTEKAMERAVRCAEAGYGPDVMAFTFSMTQSHSLRNAGRTQEEYWTQIPAYVHLCHSAGIKANFAIAGTFGCPIEGPVPPQRVFEFIERALGLGCDEVTPCDTTGEATPNRVYEFYSELRRRFPDNNVHMAHFHDSRGLAMANNLAALQAGVTQLECSLGQLGGQPAFIVDGVPGLGTGPNYCPSDVVGNSATEDLVVMLDEMGIKTGVDVDKVLELGRVLECCLERELRPYCTKTGRIPQSPTQWGAVPPFRATQWARPQWQAQPRPVRATRATGSGSAAAGQERS